MKLLGIALAIGFIMVAGFGVKAYQIRNEREQALDVVEVIVPGTVVHGVAATVGRHQLTITYTIACENAVVTVVQGDTGAVLVGAVEVGVANKLPRRVRAPGGPWMKVTKVAIAPTVNAESMAQR
jgi:hypothetical protein